MSELRVDNIVDMGGSGAPKLRKGANVTGISTITQAVVGNATINAGGINATGVVTSTSNKFVGDLASGNITAGVMTATSSVVASNITINSGGVNASGIVSATSYQGSGANLTGIGLSIAPLIYNPTVGETNIAPQPTIELTVNQRIVAGSGNVSLRMVSAGSTIIENFGVGSSVTINNDGTLPKLSFTPTSTLSADSVIFVDIPAGAFKTPTGTDIKATNWTFTTKPTYQLWSWGDNEKGELGQNQSAANIEYSSPVQIGGDSNWDSIAVGKGNVWGSAIKADGTLWVWGENESYGQLGLNDKVNRSSPTQIPGTTWNKATRGRFHGLATKTDGTLWVWGDFQDGALGTNGPTNTHYSSPIQIGSDTTWGTDAGHLSASDKITGAIKTDGTLWMWGENEEGELGQNDTNDRSSPVQVPGTTWRTVSLASGPLVSATKTDGTMWVWGNGFMGANGQNDVVDRSSPVQVPGTTWSKAHITHGYSVLAAKTDGTLWSWGYNGTGELGQNSRINYSSPVQIPGTTWSTNPITLGAVWGSSVWTVKTDGTAWVWGDSYYGQLGLNTNGAVGPRRYSSPTQLPGTNWASIIGGSDGAYGLRT